MKDILERLLSRATHTFIIQGNPNLYYDAAHEIERLRAENEKLHREAAIRIDQIEREQEAHLKTMAELNEQIASSKQLRDFIVQYSQRYGRMREALKPFAYYASQIPEDVSNTASASGTVGDLRAAAAAIGETGE